MQNNQKTTQTTGETPKKRNTAKKQGHQKPQDAPEAPKTITNPSPAKEAEKATPVAPESKTYKFSLKCPNCGCGLTVNHKIVTKTPQGAPESAKGEQDDEE